MGPSVVIGLATSPLRAVIAALGATVVLSAMWLLILRFGRSTLKRFFAIALSMHAIGLILILAPVLALSLQIVWPSLFIMTQTAAVGAGLTGLAFFGSAVALVWVTLAAVIDRL